ncbi:hypothetical protein FRC18_003350 [Serendipita sp. 400]|nr:hypothetical protein FRC18_003350 [Serendipita sp. 400]
MTSLLLTTIITVGTRGMTALSAPHWWLNPQDQLMFFLGGQMTLRTSTRDL